jgi:hypothetical protein
MLSSVPLVCTAPFSISSAASETSGFTSFVVASSVCTSTLFLLFSSPFCAGAPPWTEISGDSCFAAASRSLFDFFCFFAGVESGATAVLDSLLCASSSSLLLFFDNLSALSFETGDMFSVDISGCRLAQNCRKAKSRQSTKVEVHWVVNASKECARTRLLPVTWLAFDTWSFYTRSQCIQMGAKNWTTNRPDLSLATTWCSGVAFRSNAQVHHVGQRLAFLGWLVLPTRGKNIVLYSIDRAMLIRSSW